MKERTVVRHFCIGQGHLLFHHATHNPTNNKALENVAMFASGLKHNYKPDKRKKKKQAGNQMWVKKWSRYLQTPLYRTATKQCKSLCETEAAPPLKKTALQSRSAKSLKGSHHVFLEWCFNDEKSRPCLALGQYPCWHYCTNTCMVLKPQRNKEMLDYYRRQRGHRQSHKDNQSRRGKSAGKTVLESCEFKG